MKLSKTAILWICLFWLTLLLVGCSGGGSGDSGSGGSGGRVYAPHVVVDLEGDGVPEIVFGARHEV